MPHRATTGFVGASAVAPQSGVTMTGIFWDILVLTQTIYRGDATPRTLAKGRVDFSRYTRMLS